MVDWCIRRGLTIDTAGVVILVPGPAFALPDGMFDELLSVFVEAVGYVLSWNPRFDVIALHLLDDLNSV